MRHVDQGEAAAAQVLQDREQVVGLRVGERRGGLVQGQDAALEDRARARPARAGGARRAGCPWRASGETSRCRRASSSRVRSRMARSCRRPPRPVSSRPAKMLAATLRFGKASISWWTTPIPRAERVARARGAGAARRPGAARPRRARCCRPGCAGAWTCRRRSRPRSRAPRPPPPRSSTPRSACTAPNDLWTSWNSSRLTPRVRRGWPAGRPRPVAGGTGRPPAAARALAPASSGRRALVTYSSSRSGPPNAQLVGCVTGSGTDALRACRPARSDAGPRRPTGRPTRSPSASTVSPSGKPASAGTRTNGRRFAMAPVAESKSKTSMRRVGLST